ncbi:hypothetical protein HHK36_004577 [Tetracentron sinense]|uniref:RRM domain-containing protein n=1 Tax=Tetracentron sinense TaxID=13715 RepID=A0A835DPK9_TETSI|nr:hypothetical protein HHK36_004577 [Tetracentron sinense]
MENPRVSGGLEGGSSSRPPDPPPLSFAVVVGRPGNVGGSSPAIIPIKQPTTYKGEPALFFTEDETKLLPSPHRLTLVAKCSYGRPSLDIIKTFMKKSARVRLACSVGILDSRHLLFRFSSEEDYLMIWIKEVMYINGFLFRFFKWTPSFVSAIEPSIVLIWVSFPNLPLHLFNDSAIRSIGSIIGKVLKLDGATQYFSKPSVDRACIEVDLLKQNPDRFWLVGKSKEQPKIADSSSPIMDENIGCEVHSRDGATEDLYPSKLTTPAMKGYKASLKDGVAEDTSPQKVTRSAIQGLLNSSKNIGDFDNQPHSKGIEFNVQIEDSDEDDISSGQFGDTTYTKLFVGGLAWETQRETMKKYFEQFGEILEAVVITDKNTGRSKGYGFVTFREPEAAMKACVDAAPVIDGRRANCNLASLGVQRSRPSTPQHGGGRNFRVINSFKTAGLQGGGGTAFPSAATFPHYAFQQGIPYNVYGYSLYSPDYAYPTSYYGVYGGTNATQYPMYGVGGEACGMTTAGFYPNYLQFGNGNGNGYPAGQGYGVQYPHDLFHYSTGYYDGPISLAPTPPSQAGVTMDLKALHAPPPPYQRHSHPLQYPVKSI